MRGYLREHLPNAMVAGQVIWLEAIPLQPNGKVDRRALPAPVAGGASVERSGGRSPLEELLVEVWSQVLGQPQDGIGIRDSFFALGGHSLSATRLMSRVRALVQVEMPLRSLFEHPTIEQLAQQVQQELERGSHSSAPALRPMGRQQPLPLSFAQQRLWFLDQLDPGSVAYLIPLVLRLPASLQVAALAQALTALQERHESLRTTIVLQGETPVQVIAPLTQPQIPLIDLSELSVDERDRQARRLASQERQGPCDLVRGPLLRATLLRLPQEHLLLPPLPHIISDGWSNEILGRELTVLYQAGLSGQPPSLPG